MAKKQWTPEERAAFAEKMKAARAAKTQHKAEETVKEVEDSKVEAQTANPTIEDLIKQVEELKKAQFFNQPQQQPLARTVTKYSIRLSDYPDPRSRLMEEPRLIQKAFKQNFVLEWYIRPHRYDAKDGVHYTEPGFRVELWRRAEDPKTGELTDKTFLVQKATFFEDPDSAIQAAHDHGVNISDQQEKDYWNPQERAFLDEMRYLRIRDWLFQIFWPAPVQARDNVREEVFGNALRPVKILETSSESPKSIDFTQL